MSSQQPFVDPPTSAAGTVEAVLPSANVNGGSDAATVGEIAHVQHLSDHIGALYLSDEYSDVTLVVEGSVFRAHRVILAARSHYFRALLFGGMKESHLSEVELKDTPLRAFQLLLRYIYTGKLNLMDQKDVLVLDVLGLSHQYGFTDLEASISDYLRAVLSVKNVANIYDTASLYQLQNLIQSCYGFMDRQATEVIQHESFMALSASGVEDIISRDSFCAPEVEIFKAVYRWVQCNPNEANVERILRVVRLSLMSTQDLLKVVRPTGLVPPDVMLDAIQSRTESRDMELKYRGYLIPEENVCTPKHGAVVVQGEVKQALLDGDTRNYDMDNGFTRHSIDDNLDTAGIVIRLGTQCIINHVRLLLWDRELRRSYSYVLDVSMDQNDWVRVVDHSKFHCRTWQKLYFTPRVVRYLRITGTYNSVNKSFHAVALEAYYTKTPFRLDEHNIVVPSENVATIPKHAIVKEGVCRTRNALLNEDTSNYNWDSGYTCHQLGSGSIVVQLGQPYALDSMRLLLWDCDDRSYSYYVEVSRNEKEWEVVCDRSQVPCRSWQTITFPRRPVVYIRIVGTHNTANEVFHCVHFECPAVTLQLPPTSLTSSDVSNDEADDDDEEGKDGKQEVGGADQQNQTTKAEDSSSSIVANFAANFQEEDDGGSSVSVTEGGAAAVVDEMSHHSSPASYAGSVSESTSGIRANNSLPVGASACSIAREQELKASSAGKRRASPPLSSANSSSPSSPPLTPNDPKSCSKYRTLLQKGRRSLQQQQQASGGRLFESPFGSANSLPANVSSSNDAAAAKSGLQANRDVTLAQRMGSTSSSPSRRRTLSSFEDPLPENGPSRICGSREPRNPSQLCLPVGRRQPPHHQGNGDAGSGDGGGAVPRRNIVKNFNGED